MLENIRILIIVQLIIENCLKSGLECVLYSGRYNWGSQRLSDQIEVLWGPKFVSQL